MQVLDPPPVLPRFRGAGCTRLAKAGNRILLPRVQLGRIQTLLAAPGTAGGLIHRRRGARERAYFLWENDSCPDGRADEYWQKAHDEHLQGRAYVLWQQEGSPEGQADEQWHQSRQSEMP
jgi:hypothetical protein